MAKPTSVVFSHWYHFIENLQESTQNFYGSLDEAIKQREIPNIDTSRIDYREGGIFSAKREYFRVKRKEYIFDICAAPFGKAFFVSWWLGEKPSALLGLLLMIPFVGSWLANAFKPKTYYQEDTALMFQESVHAAVLDVVDRIMQAQGIRALSELDRKPILKGLGRQ